MGPRPRAARLAFAAAVLFVAAAGCSRDPVVARIGEREVTLSRFEADFVRVSAQDTTLRNGEEGLRQFMDDVVNKNLLELVARERFPELTAEQVARLEKTTGDLLRDEYLRREVTDRIRVTEDEVKAFHESRKKSYATRHILLPTRAAADSVLAAIRGGEDFARMAALRSSDSLTAIQGGQLPPFRPGMFVPEFESVVMPLAPGGLTVLETAYGFHVVRLDSVTASLDTTSLVVEGPRIEEFLKNREGRELRQQVTERLVKEYGAAVEGEALAWFDGRLALATRAGLRGMPEFTGDEAAKSLARFEGGRITVADYVAFLRERPRSRWPRGGNLRQQEEMLRECLLSTLSGLESKRQGLDKEKEIVEILRDRQEQLRVTRLYEEDVNQVVEADEEDWRAYYEAHRMDFQEPESWRAQIIGVSDSLQAAALSGALRSGQEFEAVAARARSLDSLAVVSDVQGMPVLSDPRFSPYAAVVRNLPVGGVSDPTRVDGRWTVAKVIEHRAARILDYDEALQNVQTGALTQKKEERLQAILADARKKHAVTVNEDVLKRVRAGRASGRAS
jgi:peptidyl-prolyl cis-trans isomerase C